MKRMPVHLSFLLSLLAPAISAAPAKLPVKEVTAFKDGHAFVLHEGQVSTEGGNVILDQLPAPVIGTFWAYSVDPAVRLSSVVAGQRKTTIERTSLSLRELIRGNVGADVSITESDGRSYTATILGLPTRSGEELTATSPPNAPERPSEESPLVLLRQTHGTTALPIDRIKDLVFREPPKLKSGQEELRSALTLRLDWGAKAPAEAANVGLVYLQKGIRWIPSYKVDLDGKGQARVSLRATVLNELIDLEDVTLQLVIGMPSFYFKDTIDPMALQQTTAALSQFFQTDPSRTRASSLALNFNNSLMSQVGRAGDYRAAGGGGDAGGGDGGNVGTAGSKQEDLYVFTLPHFTLKKGERANLLLAEFSVPYTDVFTLNLPFAPPAELRKNFDSNQQAELARLFNSPSVTHKARLQNKSPYPFTTAPVLLLREGRILAQGLMTYAAAGANVDVKVTAALDIAVKKTDRETKNTPNALNVAGHQYLRVDLEGQIVLTSHKKEAVEVEVVRHALGQIDSADHEGKVEMSNVFEGDHLTDANGDMPDWWSWSSWPWWWHQVNGVGRSTWKVKLEPGQPLELGYTWHYHRL